MFLDVGIEIPLVEKEGAALAILHDRQTARPNKIAKLPGAETQIARSLLKPNQPFPRRETRLRFDFRLISIGHSLVTPPSKYLRMLGLQRRGGYSIRLISPPYEAISSCEPLAGAPETGRPAPWDGLSWYPSTPARAEAVPDKHGA